MRLIFPCKIMSPHGVQCMPLDMTLLFGKENTQDGLRVALVPATGTASGPIRTAITELPGPFVPLRTKGYAAYLERRVKVIEDATREIRTVGEKCIHMLEGGMSTSRMDQMVEVERYTSELLQVLHEVSVSVDERLVVAMDGYLRLRHNARMAHIASTEFRQKHNFAMAQREHQAMVRAFFCVYVRD